MAVTIDKDLESESGQVKRRTDGFFRTATVYPLSTKALRGHACTRPSGVGSGNMIKEHCWLPYRS
jgi:hypothetical protein